MIKGLKVKPPPIPSLGSTMTKLCELEASQLVLTHTKQLYRGARSMGFCDVDAQDLVQEVWLSYFAKEEAFQNKSKLSTYLYGILINKCRERWKLNRRSTNLDHDEFEKVYESNFDQKGHWVSPPTTPHQFSEALSDREALEKCLEKVPPTQKAAFTLRDIEECDVSDICEELQVSQSNVHVLLFRARASLRECLERAFLLQRAEV